MKAADMLGRNLLLALCISSCLSVACTGDDEEGSGGSSGNAGEAGAPDQGGSNRGGSNQGGSGGSNANGASAGKAGSAVGEAGEPSGGTGPGPGPGPDGGGAGGESPATFVEFVHDLVQHQTSDNNQPTRVEQQFSETRDDHGHYQTPDSAFNDLF